MWTIRKPTERAIQRFLAQQRELELTCPCISVDFDSPPHGYQLDQNRVLLGEGDEVYSRACSLLERWEMFPRHWISVFPHDAAQELGVVVASVARAFGFWWTNPCRITEVYAEGNQRPVKELAGRGGDAYGFTYGTLPGHVECGAERFLIIRDSDGQVWYDIRAYSRPRFWPVKAAKPLARRLQKRFVRDSLQRMAALTNSAVTEAIVPLRQPDLPTFAVINRHNGSISQGNK